MTIWKWAGAAIGGVGGFFAGGPAGAAAGASLGYSIGSSADQANAQADAQSGNQAAALSTLVDPNAWQQVQPGSGIAGPGGMNLPEAERQRLLELSTQYNAGLEELKKMEAAIAARWPVPPPPGRDAEYEAAIRQLDAKRQQSADFSTYVTQQMKDSTLDANVFAGKSAEAERREGPKVDPTKIQETNVDFGRANDTLDRQAYDFRATQLAQAKRLMANEGQEGQQELVRRLEADMRGEAPSLAQLQLQEGRDMSVTGAASIANSARGNTQGIAQLEALRANQATMQKATRDAAMLRAQEYAQARAETAGVLGTMRGQNLQGQNIAATELGQGRQQDIGVAGIQSQNALSQAQIEQATRLAQANMDQDTKKANLLAYFQQQGLNSQMAMYWADKYTREKERATDLAVDYQKTNSNNRMGLYQIQVGQQNMDADRQQRRDAAIAQGIASGGTSLAMSKPATGVTGGTPGTPAPGTPQPAPAPTPYTDTTIVDPWKTP